MTQLTITKPLHMRPPMLRVVHDEPPDTDEIIVDCFAGGGGASLGIEEAGFRVDIAINHDPEALAMHAINHPLTTHYAEDVKDVDPVAVCQGRPVGLAWFSPDCKHHSKAKGGPPIRDKKVRALAWTVVDWAKLVRPRVIILENVEEFVKWGPLNKHGKIIKSRIGEEYEFWWRRMEHLGYTGEARILSAHHYGTPTTRKRLFIVWRCDGQPIAWPEPTHGEEGSGLLPYRTAAECIDFSLPCPSIFMTKRQARAFKKRTGIQCKRPLAKKTMARIARGLRKYLFESVKPFLVPVSHGGVGRNDLRVYDGTEPMRTVTGAQRGEFAVVQPFLSSFYGESGANDSDRPRATGIDEPVPTQTTANRFAVIAPVVVRTDMHQSNAGCAYPATDPLRTTTTAHGGGFAVIAPSLVQTGYGEREGQQPRCLDIQKPLTTVVGCGQRHALVHAFLAKHFSERPTGGWNGGAPFDVPMGTSTTRDHHSVVATNLVKLRGTSDGHMDASSLPTDHPLPTQSAGGNHFGHVQAFLTKFFRTGTDESVNDPFDTLTTRERYSLVVIDGQEYRIDDVGMRMLIARELFRANGFPDWYVIEFLYNGKPLSAKAQVRMCGNAVCPLLARVLVEANYVPARRAIAPSVTAEVAAG